jgi:tetratricopeptide (TPR) repeat protein
MSNQSQQVVYVSQSRAFRAAKIGRTLLNLLLFLLVLSAASYSTIRKELFHEHFVKGGRYLDQKQYDLAIHEYQAAIAINDSAGPQFYNLALCYTRQNRYDLAVAPLQKAIQRDAYDENYYFLLARCDNHLSHLDQAVAEYQMAIQIKPSDADARYNLAMIDLKLGKKNDAMEQLNEAHRLSPTDADVNAALKLAL